jgi:hypothetical protein
MHRLRTFLAVCALSGAMAFAQDTGQAPASGVQSSGSNSSATPNSNGTSPSSAQGQASRTPSTPNQSLPGDSNPANAATRDGRANGTAALPNSDNRNGNPADSTDNNGIKRDDTGSNPASTHAPTNTDMGTRGGMLWLWIALGVIAVIALISALASRSRGTEVSDVDPRWRRDEPDVIRREEIYRARRDDIDRDDDQIRRAS